LKDLALAEDKTPKVKAWELAGRRLDQMGVDQGPAEYYVRIVWHFDCKAFGSGITSITFIKRQGENFERALGRRAKEMFGWEIEGNPAPEGGVVRVGEEVRPSDGAPIVFGSFAGSGSLHCSRDSNGNWVCTRW
jgi:hypothetical protein